MLLHSLCNWLVLFFPHTVPRYMYCRLVYQCHWYPRANTKWGQPCSCCLLLFISALVCISVTFLVCDVYSYYIGIVKSISNFHCVLCVYPCTVSAVELLLIINYVFLVMTTAFSVTATFCYKATTMWANQIAWILYLFLWLPHTL